jgi:glycosyltransferase involved in cell wall biosynthesis
MKKRRILFLGETYRADAITWINGLKEFGDFEIVTWELKTKSDGLSRLKRILEFMKVVLTFKSIARKFNADMVIAERTTSYGFLAGISGISPKAIAQQGITDLWPEKSFLYSFKKLLQDYAFKKADLIHAWGPIMEQHMQKSNVNMAKVMVMPKGIDLNSFHYINTSNEPIINTIVTRSLQSEYKHETILKAFAILKEKNIAFNLTIVGGGILLNTLTMLTKQLGIESQVKFTGKIDYLNLPKLLQESNIYISMPTTEGVSASLFEAMACGCFPIVTDLPGNRSWIKQGVNGVLVPSENEKELANKIEWAFTNTTIRQNAIIENRKFVEKHANYAINMKKIATKYHQLIDLKNPTKCVE